MAIAQESSEGGGLLKSDDVEKLLGSLPPEQANALREHMRGLEEGARKAAAAAIMARNFSHGIGAHVR